MPKSLSSIHARPCTPPPQDKSPVGAMPQAAEQIYNKNIGADTEPALSIPTQRNINVIPEKAR